MKEIRTLYQQHATKRQDIQHASAGINTKKRKTDPTSSSSSSSSTGDYENLNGRVLVYVKDERTAMHVRDILAFGLSYVMDQRHRWFVSQQAADIRQKHQPIRQQQTSSSSSSSSVGISNDTATSTSCTSCTSTANAAIDSENSSSTDYLGLGISKIVFDKLSDENKLILFHVSTLTTHITEL
jgi:Tfp pilus tip-associated adhesin PilY1